MEDFLVGIIKFIGNFCSLIIDMFKPKLAIIVGIIILIICFLIIYILLKNN